MNRDGEEAKVPSFVAREKWDVPVSCDGLDDFMKVETLPTVLVVGPDGQIIYRTAGGAPEGFSESLVRHKVRARRIQMNSAPAPPQLIQCVCDRAWCELSVLRGVTRSQNCADVNGDRVSHAARVASR